MDNKVNKLFEDVEKRYLLKILVVLMVLML